MAYFMTYFDAGINYMDEGTLLTPIDRILSGQLPYRDFYRIYTPGRWYLFAALFKIFGSQFLITRVVWALGHALMNGLVYRLCRRALPVGYALIPAVALTLAPGPWHKTPFMLSIVAGIWLATRFAARPTLAGASTSGLGTALIFFFRQDAGVFYAGVAGLFALIYSGEKRIANIAGIAAVFLFPTALWMGLFFAVGGGREMVAQVLFAGAKGFATNPVPYPGLFDPPPNAGGVDWILGAMGGIAFYLPFIIVPAFAIIVAVKYKKSDRTSSALMLATALSVVLAANQLRARSDFPHLWQAYTLFHIMAAFVIGTIGETKRKTAVAVAVVFLLIIAGAAFSSSYLHHGSARILEHRSVRYANEMMPVRLTEAENTLFSSVEKTIGKYARKGDAVFLAPNIPLFYFLTQTRNPTPWDVVRPSFLWGQKDELKATELINKAHTKLVVVREPRIPPANEKLFSEVYTVLYAYIIENYRLVDKVENFKFYSIKSGDRKESDNANGVNNDGDPSQ